jgi:hypothetical protein
LGGETGGAIVLFWFKILGGETGGAIVLWFKTVGLARICRSGSTGIAGVACCTAEVRTTWCVVTFGP